MNGVLAEVLSKSADPYDTLPTAIRQYYSREQYLWLTDAEKASLIQRETEPDA